MNFKPFSFQCVTCGSRLRVNNPSLVGNIVTCPSCQSMVQITPPEDDANGLDQVEQAADETDSGAGNFALGNASVDSEALTQESIAADIGLPQSTTQNQREPRSPLPPPMPGGEPEPSHGSAPPVEAANATAGDQPTPLPADWHLQKSSTAQRAVLIGGIVVASLLSIGILVAVIMRSNGKQVASVPDPAAVDATDDPAVKDPAENPAAEPKDASSDDEGTDDPPQQPPAVEPPDTANNPPATAQGTADPDERTTDGGNSSAIPSGLLPENPLLPQSPLQGMAADLEKPNGQESNPANDSEAEGPSDLELPDHLKDLLGDLSSDLEKEQVQATDPAPKTLDEIEVDLAAQRRDAPDQRMAERPPINLKRSLDGRLALQVKTPEGYRFFPLLEIVQHYSDIPFDLRWVELDIAGVDMNQRVPVPKGWTTLRQVLDDSCGRMKLEYSPTPYTIVVRPDPELLQARFDELYNFNDLGEPGSDQVESAVAMAKQVLGLNGDPAAQPAADPDAPEGEAAAVPAPTAPGHCPQPVGEGQRQIGALVCDAIRRIRSAASKIDDQAYAKWAGPLQQQIAGWPLLDRGQNIPQPLHPIAFGSLVRQLGSANQTSLFVNWNDALPQGLDPGILLMPHIAADETAGQTLKKMLSPIELQTRIVDGKHWWIGSQATFDRLPVIFWIKSDDPQAVAGRIQQVIIGARLQEAVIAGVAVDPSTGHCLAVLPRYLLRQLPRLLDDMSLAGK